MSQKATQKNSDFAVKCPKYFGLRLTPWTHLVTEMQDSNSLFSLNYLLFTSKIRN